jgi:hypothetical protein
MTRLNGSEMRYSVTVNFQNRHDFFPNVWNAVKNSAAETAKAVK